MKIERDSIGEKYRELLENAIANVFAYGPDGTILAINDYFLKSLGYTSEEVINKNIRDFIFKDEINKAFLSIKKRIETGKSETKNTYRVRKKDGEYVYLEFFGIPLKREGKVYAVLSISHDVTNLKLAEEKLRASEEKYRNISKRYEMLLESITDAVFVLNTDYVYTLVNKMAERILNISAENLLGHKIFDVFPSIEHSSIFKTFDIVMKKREPGRVRDIFTSLNGSSGYYEVSMYPFEDGILCIGRDVTEEEKAKIKLKDSEERYRELVDNANSVILTWDLDGRVIYVNEFGERCFGYSKVELIGKHVIGTLVPETESTGRDLKKMINEIIEDPDTFAESENENMTKTGKRVWISWTNRAIRDKQGNNIGILSIGNDISGKKIAENMLKDSEENYRKAYERENFYKDLFAHDMNNILQSMLISLELSNQKLKEVEIYEELKPFLDEINDQIKRGANLVKNVKMYSKLEETKSNLELKNLSDSLNNAIKIAKNYTDQKKVNITLKSPKNNLLVQADNFLIDVFENILINAIKHNSNAIVEILINISVINENNKIYLKIEIQDNGIGIPDSKKESVFKRGYKENRSTSGMGLGLSLVKKILNVYNAKIWVENRIPEDVSKGSNFIILFPFEVF